MMSLAFSKNAVYKITISGIIDLGLPPYIERVIETAEKDSADAIIFDIETPGGRVDAATQIKDAILGTDILTIAFINRRAISAGALISLSCEKIYMTGGGTIGAATAVDMQGNKASEKVISYMREEMASTAEIRGKDVTIARGMVDDSLSFTHLVIDGDSLEVNDIEGRKKGKLITLTTNLALKYKIADGEAESIEEVLNKIGLTNAIIKSSKENWSENLVRFLTNPIVASLLMTFGFLGILFELQSSGWGVPGTFGGVCLLLSLSASYIAKLATATDFIIIIVGVLLLLAEILFIPGFGIAGVSGIVIIFWGIYELLLPDIPVGAEAMSDAITGLTIGIIGGLIGLALLFRLVIKTKFWENLTAPGSENRKEGYSTSIGLESYAGQNGIADTDLRPSGWILVQEERIFVITEGTFINKGDSVKILSVDGNRVLVRQLNTEEK
ncbi:MAG: nodulation protein NfeD [Candidatus Marinimicrobia bacterium]|jgi:membrane-bound serine protease (ClpP class)|nr:nodulation protein NfeD [Candidatus Neomarinimicrobiota bacterium]MBT3997640.1 nodulation protein NfeD [Candidatus Neomarinimicrobiota bacterium]MBT4280938.1 nodulation protein NfeD [Candidatus Neomarinimicrobiota bacterium]MBT4569774.1 nodulation protein NfeD [Candidatus Neomarinimicrobiota bacterium]MBT4796384.1 nodulation protein NfeD [Candidatus Neomarinimicrobiota bacterium]